MRALSVDADGKLVGAVQDLGAGQFGIDARETQNLEVLPDGRALLVFQRESPNFGDPEPVVLATRPHGGAFAEPTVVGAGLTSPRVTGSTLTVIMTTVCGDTGCAGQPRSIAVNPDGTLGTPVGPTLAKPNRAFAPWATASALVFLLKTGSQPFSKEAPVRAYAAGRLQTLTTARAHEPVALALADGRTLALWATRTKLGAALAGAKGTFKKTSAPPAPDPRSTTTTPPTATPAPPALRDPRLGPRTNRAHQRPPFLTVESAAWRGPRPSATRWSRSTSSSSSRRPASSRARSARR